MTTLHADGGCIGSNPSTIGGTIAFRIGECEDGGCTHLKFARVYTPKQLHVDKVTNNQTELYAIIKGLGFILPEEYLWIYSDSEISLGRVFHGYSMKNIPEFMVKELDRHKRRLIHWDRFEHELLDGHPTQKQLEDGIGKHGHPVSIWNKWCDDNCQRVAKEYIEKHNK